MPIPCRMPFSMRRSLAATFSRGELLGLSTVALSSAMLVGYLRSNSNIELQSCCLADGSSICMSNMLQRAECSRHSGSGCAWQMLQPSSEHLSRHALIIFTVRHKLRHSGYA